MPAVRYWDPTPAGLPWILHHDLSSAFHELCMCLYYSQDVVKKAMNILVLALYLNKAFGCRAIFFAFCLEVKEKQNT